MKTESTLWTRLTERYLMVIRNEDNFAEKTSFSFSYAKLLVITTALLVLLFLVSLFVSNFILSNWLRPISKEAEMQRKLIDLAVTTDSLQDAIAARDEYIVRIRKTIQGDDSYLKTSSQQDTSVTHVNREPVKPIDLKVVSVTDAEFRSEFESQNKAQVATTSGSISSNLYLFMPLKEALISSKFDPQTAHWGVDLVAKKGEPIYAVSNGTVILASWTQDSGNVLAIQHPNHLISLYKHNSALLKKAGDFVKEGEAIAIIGNSGELTTGPHLHLELWYKGNPVNPEDFIAF